MKAMPTAKFQTSFKNHNIHFRPIPEVLRLQHCDEAARVHHLPQDVINEQQHPHAH